MKTLAIGIDIGGTRTKIGLVNLNEGHVEELLIAPTETKNGDMFLQNIGNAIDQLKAKAGVEQGLFRGIGIGVPGFVFANGQVDSTYGFLEFMEDYPLVETIEQHHQLPCLVDNDARVVALGEALYGQGKGIGRVLSLTLGTGLGIGFTINGKLDGSLPYAHMGGHMAIITDDFVCYCGKTGCLESLVSGTGMERIADRMGWTQKYPNLPLTVESILAQKQLGNLDALAIVQQYLRYLKTGIDNYVNLYAPDLIVLGGGIAKGLRAAFGNDEIDTLYTTGLLRPYKAYQARLAISQLAEQAGILGSAALFN